MGSRCGERARPRQSESMPPLPSRASLAPLPTLMRCGGDTESRAYTYWGTKVRKAREPRARRASPPWPPLPRSHRTCSSCSPAAGHSRSSQPVPGPNHNHHHGPRGSARGCLACLFFIRRIRETPPYIKKKVTKKKRNNCKGRTLKSTRALFSLDRC